MFFISIIIFTLYYKLLKLIAITNKLFLLHKFTIHNFKFCVKTTTIAFCHSRVFGNLSHMFKLYNDFFVLQR